MEDMPGYQSGKLMDKLVSKTFTLTSLTQYGSNSNMIGTGNYPDCILDNKFTLNATQTVTWDYVQMCVVPVRASPSWGISTAMDTIFIEGIDEDAAKLTSRRVSKFAISKLDTISKVLILKINDRGVNILRSYTYK